jgi:transcriptional regulator with XRE-family HTH domain
MAKYKLQVIFGLAILVCFVNFFKRTKMLNKEKLKKRRKELKYSQKKMAELIGGTQPNYNQIENRDTTFNKPDTIKKLAIALDTTVEYLTDKDVPNTLESFNQYAQLSKNSQDKVISYIKELYQNEQQE